MRCLAENTETGKDLLRFLTCGSVDDGKSTLIGRLLWDAKLLCDDQIVAIEADSQRSGSHGQDIDFALLLDGLQAEREQGITIDVAYRFFETQHRKFIVADTPGHEQYTRNMATGASTADLAVILVDARKGILTQTRRHSFIASLMGIRHVILVINKMDLVDYDAAVFYSLRATYLDFAEGLGFETLSCLPVSALKGDNVCAASLSMPWFDGAPLLAQLEAVEVYSSADSLPFRMPVQWVCRPDLDFRGFCGTVSSGHIAVGDTVVVAASGQTSTVRRIVSFDGDRAEAWQGDAVNLVIADEIDISRGDTLAVPHDCPDFADQFSARILWMHADPLLPNRTYLIKIGTTVSGVRINRLDCRINVNTFERTAAECLALNEVGVCDVAVDRAVAFDSYAANRGTGRFILIDRYSNDTVGCGMILHALRRATNVYRHAETVSKSARVTLMHQKPCILWLTGLSGSGKSTLANVLEQHLHGLGCHTMLLDGDNIRHSLNRDLGFTDADRVENIRRVGEVAKLMVEAGLIVLVAFISPFRSERRMVRELMEDGEFLEIFVDTPFDVCCRRDSKGLYAKALNGDIPNFTGVQSPYEVPEFPELRVDGTADVATSTEAILALLRARGIL
ncbi:MAG: sulfate adenylyltransferase subunit CysN [Rhodospirillaceae bacterium]|nr:sulfate adenylyltransferase subunit CysN [Rhodospirillaceae bacterium]